jgi:hypothetical protein
MSDRRISPPRYQQRRTSPPISRTTFEAEDEITQVEPFVDALEAGRFLQLPRRRVLQLARQGRLPAYPLGDGPRKIWRFRLSELSAAMLHSRQRSHVPEEI